MIGIPSQWLLQIDIGPIADAVKTEDLEFLQLQEKAGSDLPTFILKFATDDEQVTPYLNETANIAISFGRDALDHGCNVYATQVSIGKEGDNRRHIEMHGLLNYPEYLVNSRLGITTKKSAVEAMADMVNRIGLQLDPDNITTSTDMQYWIQTNIPDKKFATHLWLHANLPGSFPIIGVTVIDEYYRIFDAVQRIGRAPDWTFTWDPQGDKEIAYHGNYVMQNTTGFVNAWVGYKRDFLEYSGETGDRDIYNFDIKPLLSQAGSMPTVGINPRFGEIAMKSDNLDDNFNLTYQRNIAYLAQFSCFGTEVQFFQEFHPIMVLDLIYFRDDSTEAPKKTASEFGSGLFLATAVHHVFTSRRYTCAVKVSREAPGDVQGGGGGGGGF